MIKTHVVGFPRIGEKRELKFAQERSWRGELGMDALEIEGRAIRARHWALQREAGLDYVTVGDFAYYDHVATHIQLLGCEPARYGFNGQELELERYFKMARGDTGSDEAGRALEMTKWFDTNYHYLVPEFDSKTTFRLNSERLFDEVREAQSLGHSVKAVLVGPLTFLWLGKEKAVDFDRLGLLDALLPVYADILSRLESLGVPWVQIDEPILGLDLPQNWRMAFQRAYGALQVVRPKIMLATYFSPLLENIALACALPVDGLHIDTVRGLEDIPEVLKLLPKERELSLGIIDGRNIWRTDLDKVLVELHTALESRNGHLWIAPSCSLLHVPISLVNDEALDAELRGWLAGATEKLAELNLLKRALAGGNVEDELFAARHVFEGRRKSSRVSNPVVGARVASLDASADRRESPFALRKKIQQTRFNLPPFPTTTIGSFPQTAQVRAARAAFKRGELDEASYRKAMQQEIALAIRKQEEYGIDVLVHGEAERNDMVEYFGEQIDGFAFTANGWVQSYGSRCVKPPILYGDVTCSELMTVEWSRYAQSLTEKPVKGMLTGPVTILQWSFVRDDQARELTALQIALVIRDEVLGLESAGIGIIQIDEPAFREGLPLRQAAWRKYLDWAGRAFRIAASGVGNETQIHTHMCYAEFNDILTDIAELDADVITIETSRSDMELLRGFGEFQYPNDIGPGVYDIHSPRVPDVEEMVRLLRKAEAVIPRENLWVNPDCGLKTRGWDETDAALRNMVKAAEVLRQAELEKPQ